jgi:hypothetical protein
MYAIHKVKEQIVSDDRLRRLVDSIKQQIYGPAAPA